LSRHCLRLVSFLAHFRSALAFYLKRFYSFPQNSDMSQITPCGDPDHDSPAAKAAVNRRTPHALGASYLV
jgi:hypothetical protein